MFLRSLQVSLCFLSAYCPLYSDYATLVRQQYDPAFIQVLHFLYGENSLSERSDQIDDLLIGKSNFSNSIVLDFGCGTGGITHFIHKKFPSSRVVGVDITESCIDTAKDKFPSILYPGMEFIAYSPPHLPFLNHTFDYVIVKEVFVHIFDHAEIFKELYRILKPGGQLIVLDWFTSDVNEHNSHEIMQSTTIETFKSMLEQHSFQFVSELNISNSYENVLRNKILDAKKMLPRLQGEMHLAVKEVVVDLDSLLDDLTNKKVFAIRVHYRKPCL